MAVLPPAGLGVRVAGRSAARSAPRLGLQPERLGFGSRRVGQCELHGELQPGRRWAVSGRRRHRLPGSGEFPEGYALPSPKTARPRDNSLSAQARGRRRWTRCGGWIARPRVAATEGCFGGATRPASGGGHRLQFGDDARGKRGFRPRQRGRGLPRDPFAGPGECRPERRLGR